MAFATALTRPTPAADLPLLVLGPSLGTSAGTLWGRCLPALTRCFDVVAWDLPGHGNSPTGSESFTVEHLICRAFCQVRRVKRCP